MRLNDLKHQMDRDTRQNATMVEDSTAASQSPSRETTQLASLAVQFRVSDAGQSSPRRGLTKTAGGEDRGS